ncbi:MAG: universal stress protein [Gemmatimonadota bacterium]|nr:universal stress protein [Gemmatimonadota bacterium]
MSCDIAPKEPRLLVATDGSVAADSAVLTARMLADRDGAEIELLTVVEHAELGPPYASLGPTSEHVIAQLREDRVERIARQRVRLNFGEESWQPLVEMGQPAAAIARHAATHKQDLIVVGLSEHNFVDRLCQRETALRIARDSHVPVLAVSAASLPLPRAVAVAVALDETSLHTARVASELLGDEGTLYLVHVAPRVAVPMADSRDWQSGADNEIRGRFDSLVRDLIAPPAIRFECVTLYGDPAPELLAFSKRDGIDLVVTGSHAKRGLIGIVGSVATKLFRGVGCSILMVPPAA